MNQDEWITIFTARLVEQGGKTEDEAAAIAVDYAASYEDRAAPEATADVLIALCDDHFEGPA